MPPKIIDPCVGTGVIADIAAEAGYNVRGQDIHDWGWKGTVVKDFLANKTATAQRPDLGCMMNPPFSLAEDFVKMALQIGARKILCFQRFAWWESQDRRNFWLDYPPNRIYVCGDRATCWRHDLPKDAAGNRYDPVTQKKLAGSSTAHAWYVWERGQPRGTLLGQLFKNGVIT